MRRRAPPGRIDRGTWAMSRARRTPDARQVIGPFAVQAHQRLRLLLQILDVGHGSAAFVRVGRAWPSRPPGRCVLQAAATLSSVQCHVVNGAWRFPLTAAPDAVVISARLKYHVTHSISNLQRT